MSGQGSWGIGIVGVQPWMWGPLPRRAATPSAGGPPRVGLGSPPWPYLLCPLPRAGPREGRQLSGTVPPGSHGSALAPPRPSEALPEPTVWGLDGVPGWEGNSRGHKAEGLGPLRPGFTAPQPSPFGETINQAVKPAPAPAGRLPVGGEHGGFFAEPCALGASPLQRPCSGGARCGMTGARGGRKWLAKHSWAGRVPAARESGAWRGQACGLSRAQHEGCHVRPGPHRGWCHSPREPCQPPPAARPPGCVLSEAPGTPPVPHCPPRRGVSASQIPGSAVPPPGRPCVAATTSISLECRPEAHLTHMLSRGSPRLQTVPRHWNPTFGPLGGALLCPPPPAWYPQAQGVLFLLLFPEPTVHTRREWPRERQPTGVFAPVNGQAGEVVADALGFCGVRAVSRGWCVRP